MIALSVNNFDFEKIAVTMNRFSYANTLYSSMANHDLQPLSIERRSLNKPQDVAHSKRMARSNMAMSHLKDRKLINEHLKGR